MKTSFFVTQLTAFVIVGGLLLAGTGCTSFGSPDKTDQAANEIRDQEQNDAYVTVAMVLTENAQIPAGATPELAETIGCNDRIVFVKVPRQANTGDIVTDTLTSLFAVKDAPESYLYNGLSRSKLTVDRLQSHDGVTSEVLLKGTISSGGACDDPRIKGQIEATVARLKPKYQIWLNGSEKNWRCIGDQSGQCK